MTQLAQQVLRSYRAALRARFTAFKGDELALRASAKELRRRIDENTKETDPEKIQEHIQQLEQLQKLLKHNVLQAELKEENTYVARVHDDIERTDMPHRSGGAPNHDLLREIDEQHRRQRKKPKCGSA